MKSALPLLLLLAAAGASGCSRAQAKTTPDLPPLEVPLPPPRIVEATEPGPLTPGALVEEPARNTPRPRPAQPPRTEPSRTDPAKPDTPAATTEAAPATTVEPARPSAGPSLQTTPAGREQDVERTIVSLIAQARTTLNRVDYDRLNPNARTQYNQARQFAAQAEDALRQRNYVFAQTNAEKAATLASQLAGR